MILLIITSIPALSNEPEDTLKHWQMGEVRVSGQKEELSFIKGSQYNKLDREFISESGSRQISDVACFFPGLYIKDYGGLVGLKTISIRGMSSQNTSIMIDGIKINSTQNGTLDVGTIPLFMVQNMELIRGGVSTIFGGNSAGGVVNINSQPDTILKSTELSFSVGTFSEYIMSAGMGTRIGKVGIDAYTDVISSQGDYPYTTTSDGEDITLNRQNAELKSLSASAGFGFSEDGWDLGGRIFIYNSDRGVPSAVLQGTPQNSEAKLQESTFLGIVNIVNDRILDNDLKINIGFKVEDEIYKDPSALIFGEEGQKNEYNNKDLQINSQYSFEIQNTRNTLRFEAIHSNLYGNFMNPNEYDGVNRTSLSLGEISEIPLIISTDLDLALNLGARIDYYTDFGGAFSPLLTLIMNTKQYNLSGMISYNYRVPNFNEMYYYNFGNRDIEPEKSLSMNLGAGYKLTEGMGLSLNIFGIFSRDQILAMPKNTIVWSAMNIGSSRNLGFEVATTYQPLSKLTNVTFSYTFQSCIDLTEDSPAYGNQLVYTPSNIFNIIAYHDLELLNAGLSTQFVDERYYLTDNSSGSEMEAYFLMNLFIFREFIAIGMTFNLRLDLMNVLGTRYEIINNYPMPGRSIRGRIDIKL
jgi:vitamin B12 transporter